MKAVKTLLVQDLQKQPLFYFQQDSISVTYMVILDIFINHIFFKAIFDPMESVLFEQNLIVGLIDQISVKQIDQSFGFLDPFFKDYVLLAESL